MSRTFGPANAGARWWEEEVDDDLSTRRRPDRYEPDRNGGNGKAPRPPRPRRQTTRRKIR